MTLERKRVAAYARVSVDTDALMHSLNSQIDYFKNLIQKNRMRVFAGVFYDEGISGTSTDRPGFQNLMDKCEKGNVDVILTKSISRFARNTLDLLNTVRHLKRIGVEVRFEKEGISTFTTDGELMLTLLASFAEEESRSISENTRWAIKKRFEKGLECGGHTLFGYTKDENGNYQIVESEAEIVRGVFDNYISGMSPKSIASKYNFAYSTIWQMLRQSEYKGDIILQKTISTFSITHKANTRKKNEGEEDRFYVKDALPAIISRDVFDRAQEIMASKLVKGKVYKRNPFTSIVLCSECGRSYRRRNNESGHYWKCAGKLEHTGCKSKNIKEHLLYSLCKEHIDSLENVVVYPDKLVINTKEGKIEKRYDDSSKH